MWNEFKKFAMKGSVIDLAVGVIIGGAFGKIVTSLVQDVLIPLIGLILGGINFTGLIIKVGKAEIKYGQFIQSVIDFFIISFSIFLFVKAINRFRKKDDETPKEADNIDRKEELLMEIRDLLKDDKNFSQKNETS